MKFPIRLRRLVLSKSDAEKLLKRIEKLEERVQLQDSVVTELVNLLRAQSYAREAKEALEQLDPLGYPV